MSIAYYSRFVLAVCPSVCPSVCLGAMLLLVTSCGSTHSTQSSDAPKKSGRPLRVLYVNYTSGKKFELVNESHSDKTQTYSATKKLDEAYTKVTPDEVLDEVLVQFREAGYAAKAAPGSAPETAQGQALEVEDGGSITCWLDSKARPLEDRKSFQQCAKLFLDVYSNSYALQAVDRAPDWQNQNVPTKKKGQ
jgi:hypothetical protein